MKNDEIKLDKAVFTFVQEGNTLGTTDEYEELVLEVEAPLGDLHEGGFFVLRTNTGWSFDDKEKLLTLFDKLKESINNIVK